MSKVSFLLELAIKDGQLEAFKEMARGLIETVKDGEPGTLTYQVRIAEDGKHCLFHDVYKDSEALLTHLGNVGPRLPGLFEIAPIKRFDVLGPASQDVRVALADFSPNYFPDFAGFDR